MCSYILKQHQQKSSSRCDTNLTAIFAAKRLKWQELVECTSTSRLIAKTERSCYTTPRQQSGNHSLCGLYSKSWNWHNIWIWSHINASMTNIVSCFNSRAQQFQTQELKRKIYLSPSFHSNSCIVFIYILKKKGFYNGETVPAFQQEHKQ